jgi:mRNA-degrading endonuclease toxin of MazEF toxin-antitoxin module
MNIKRGDIFLAAQIRTIDKSRLIKYIGLLPEKDIEAVNNSLKIHLDLMF